MGDRVRESVDPEPPFDHLLVPGARTEIGMLGRFRDLLWAHLPRSRRRPGSSRNRGEQQRAHGYAAAAWQQHDPVFTQVDGKPTDPRADGKVWKAASSHAAPELALRSA